MAIPLLQFCQHSAENEIPHELGRSLRKWVMPQNRGRYKSTPSAGSCLASERGLVKGQYGASFTVVVPGMYVSRDVR